MTRSSAPADRSARQIEAGNQVVNLVAEQLFPIEQGAPPGTGKSYGIADLARRRMDLWWVGPQPAALRRLAAHPGHRVTLRIHRGTLTEAQLDAAAGRVLTHWQARDAGADPDYRPVLAGFNPTTGRIDVTVQTPDQHSVPAGITALIRKLNVGVPIGAITQGQPGSLGGTAAAH